MPVLQATEQQIKTMYKNISKRTENFRNISPKILMESPRTILILRLSLGMSQNKFEEFLGSKNKNIAKYETGKIKKMQQMTAEKITSRIVEEIKKTTLKNVLANYRKSKVESEGWFRINKDNLEGLKARRKGAIESLKKRTTPQEQILSQELSKLQIKNISNYALAENIIVDNFIPEKNLVIECKEIKSISKRENREQIQKLAYQGYKTKFRFPDKKLWALVKTGTKLIEVERQELKGPFDYIFTDVSELINKLSNWPKSVCPEFPGPHALHNACHNGMQLRKEKQIP